jgi:glycosyltransferase involved in cell wall biosynthesis
LKRAIRSALNQTRSDLVVSIFDNASGDETPDVVASFMKSDHRVRYFCQTENVGLVKNFQYGMSKVDTPYFSILSDDDLILPHLYQEAIDALEREPSAIFFAAETVVVGFDGNFRGHKLQGWQSGVYHPPEGLYAILRAGLPFWTSVVFKREVVSQIGLRDAGTASDRDLLIRVGARYPFVVSKMPGSVFFSNPRSATWAAPFNAVWQQNLAIMQEMRDGAEFPEQYRTQALRLFQEELEHRIFSHGQRAAMTGGKEVALEWAQVLENYFRSKRKASRIRLLATLNRFGLGRPVAFAADASRSLRHLPTSLRRLMDNRRYRRSYRSLVTELL